MGKTPFLTQLASFFKATRSFIVFITLMLVFRSACADWYTVPTGSMQPTIHIGDRVTVNKMAYDLRLPFSKLVLLRTGEPARGDIMVFDSNAAQNRLIKRVVGLPGDTVEMQDEVLLINGKPLAYRHEDDTNLLTTATEQLGELAHQVQWDKSRPAVFANFSAITIPEDYYLVLGDNRRQSADSRVYGLVPRHELLGRASYVAFSMDYDNYYLPRADRFAKSLYSEH